MLALSNSRRCNNTLCRTCYSYHKSKSQNQMSTTKKNGKKTHEKKPEQIGKKQKRLTKMEKNRIRVKLDQYTRKIREKKGSGKKIVEKGEKKKRWDKIRKKARRQLKGAKLLRWELLRGQAKAEGVRSGRNASERSLWCYNTRTTNNIVHQTHIVITS